MKIQKGDFGGKYSLLISIQVEEEKWFIDSLAECARFGGKITIEPDPPDCQAVSARIERSEL